MKLGSAESGYIISNSNYPVPAFGVDSSVVAIMMLSRYFPNTN